MNEINTIPIQQFIQLVKAADLGQQREIKMDIKTAKTLMYCISEVNNLLLSDFSAIMSKRDSTSNDSVVINMDGGNFK
jgi:hypothetical protein